MPTATLDCAVSAPGWLRCARASITAGVALSLGALAHTTAGGLLPSAPVLLALAAFSVLGCWLLLGRPASTARLVLLVVAVQSAGHGAFTALAGHAESAARVGAQTAVAVPDRLAGGTGAAVLDGARRTGSLRDLTVPDAAASVPAPGLSDWLAHLLQDLTGPHAVMALAHLVAAVLLGVWLAMGEQALVMLPSLGNQAARAAVARTVVALRESSRWGTAVLDLYPEPGALRARTARAAYDVRLRPVAAACRAVSRRGPPALLVHR